MDMETQTSTTMDLARKLLTMSIRGQKSIQINHVCHLPRSERADPRARKEIIFSSILCVILMICETCAGIISNSISLILDAIHLLVDFTGFMAALFAIWVAKRPPSQQMNFGWHRAEVIAILYVVVIMWYLIGILGFLAVRRIINGNYTVSGKIMIIAAALSIIVNFVIGIQLRHHNDRKLQRYWRKRRLWCCIQSSQKNHHNIQFNRDNLLSKVQANKCVQTAESHIDLNAIDSIVRKKPKTNFGFIFISALTDIVQSVAVFLVGIIIYVRSDWSLADLILALIFIVFIMVTTFGILRDSLLMLMESTPSYVEYDEVISTFLSIKGVHDIHNLRIWALNMDKVACIVHLDIEPDANPTEILRDANNVIHQRFQFFETTIQIDQ